MKTIDIYIVGEFDYRTKVGFWVYYLSYKSAVIKRSGSIANAMSDNRVALIALYKAISKVTEPCTINVHSKNPLGFRNPSRAYNKDLVIKIAKLISESGHIIDFIENDSFEKVDLWESTIGAKKRSEDSEKYRLVDSENNDKINKAKDNKTVSPDLPNIANIDPNDVFKTKNENWMDMYDDLLNDSGKSNWVPGSGGY